MAARARRFDEPSFGHNRERKRTEALHYAAALREGLSLRGEARPLNNGPQPAGRDGDLQPKEMFHTQRGATTVIATTQQYVFRARRYFP